MERSFNAATRRDCLLQPFFDKVQSSNSGTLSLARSCLTVNRRPFAVTRQMRHARDRDADREIHFAVLDDRVRPIAM